MLKVYNHHQPDFKIRSEDEDDMKMTRDQSILNSVPLKSIFYVGILSGRRSPFGNPTCLVEAHYERMDTCYRTNLMTPLLQNWGEVRTSMYDNQIEDEDSR